MIISRTPFRVSFFGGGTDYPGWFREHGDAVLATAIDKYCYISCRYLPPFFEHHSRVIYSQVENVGRNGDIRHPSVRASLKYLGIEAGVEIHHDADLPARTGLGTSSSFTVGLLHALYALQGQLKSCEELARAAIHLEQEVLGENVGIQDQIIAAYGGFNLMRFGSSGGVAVQPLPLSPTRLREIEAHLLLGFTGFSRTASEIAQRQIENTPHRVRELEAMQTLVAEAAAIVSDEARPLAEFGRLLDRGWRLKRRLSEQISTPAIDRLYEAGRAAGAEGGKLLGAGGGGFLLFCVPPERQQGFREALNSLLWVPVRLAAPGSQLVYYEPATSFGEDLVLHRQRIYAQHA